MLLLRDRSRPDCSRCCFATVTASSQKLSRQESHPAVDANSRLLLLLPPLLLLLLLVLLTC